MRFHCRLGLLEDELQWLEVVVEEEYLLLKQLKVDLEVEELEH